MIKCDVCESTGEPTLVDRDGHQVRFPPKGWRRIVAIQPCECGEGHHVHHRNACSLRCFQILASGLVASTLPPEVIKAVEDTVREATAKIDEEKRGMN